MHIGYPRCVFLAWVYNIHGKFNGEVQMPRFGITTLCNLCAPDVRIKLTILNFKREFKARNLEVGSLIRITTQDRFFVLTLIERRKIICSVNWLSRIGHCRTTGYKGRHAMPDELRKGEIFSADGSPSIIESIALL